MAERNLPDDLVSFLRSGRRLEYDPAVCEAGAIALLGLDQLRVEYFPMSSESPDDPHANENGSYMVQGVSLLATCEYYDPVGLLLWLPLDRQYGLWDGEHGTLLVFGTDVHWSDIVKDPPRYINAEWAIEGSAPVTELIPWQRHWYNAEQLCHPLPDLAEWYEANWTRRGVYRDGVQLRYPEEIRIRIECEGNRIELRAQFKKPEKDASLSAPSSRSLDADEWHRLQTWLDSGFWDEPCYAVGDPGDETVTMWTFSGYRNQRYHWLFRSYDDSGGQGDPVYELGEQLILLAKKVIRRG